MSMDRPTYLVLREPIPISESNELLGRITVDYTSPTDISAPTSVKHLVSKYALQPVESEDLDILLSLSSGNSSQGRLEAIFEVAASRGRTRGLRIQTSKVRTHRLKDHDKVFQDLLRDRETLAEVKKLFDYSLGRAVSTRKQVYMIVGFKSIFDATVTYDKSDQQSTRVDVTVPVSAAIDTVLPGGSLFLNMVDPGVGVSTERSESLSQSQKIAQEQVFAIEYRPITRPFLLKKSGDWKPKLSAQKKRFDWGTATMGDDNDDDDEDLPELARSDVEQEYQVSVLPADSFDLFFTDKK